MNSMYRRKKTTKTTEMRGEKHQRRRRSTLQPEYLRLLNNGGDRFWGDERGDDDELWRSELDRLLVIWVEWRSVLHVTLGRIENNNESSRAIEIARRSSRRWRRWRSDHDRLEPLRVE